MTYGISWEEPQNIEEKKEMLLKNGIAIWDVLESCDIQGSSDSSIKNPVVADIPGLLKKTKIDKIIELKIWSGVIEFLIYMIPIQPCLQ